MCPDRRYLEEAGGVLVASLIVAWGIYKQSSQKKLAPEIKAKHQLGDTCCFTKVDH